MTSKFEALEHGSSNFSGLSTWLTVCRSVWRVVMHFVKRHQEQSICFWDKMNTFRVSLSISENIPNLQTCFERATVFYPLYYLFTHPIRLHFVEWNFIISLGHQYMLGNELFLMNGILQQNGGKKLVKGVKNFCFPKKSFINFNWLYWNLLE